MMSVGILMVALGAGSLPSECLLGPANCEVLERADAAATAGCLRYRTDAAMMRAACDQGRAESCLELGNLTLSCDDESQNDRALDLYIRACALEAPTGCMRAGDRASSPAARNSWYQRTAEIYERGCANGDAVSCFALSAWLYDGLYGVGRDMPRAAELAANACRTGLLDACYRAAALYEAGPGDIVVDRRRAAELRALNCPPGRSHFSCP